MLEEAPEAGAADVYVGRALRNRRHGHAKMPAQPKPKKEPRDRKVEAALSGRNQSVFELAEEEDSLGEEEDYYFSD